MPTNDEIYETYRRLSQNDTNTINNALQSGKRIVSVQGQGTYINGVKAQNTADDYMKSIVGNNRYGFFNGQLHTTGDVSNIPGAVQVTQDLVNQAKAAADAQKADPQYQAQLAQRAQAMYGTTLSTGGSSSGSTNSSSGTINGVSADKITGGAPASNPTGAAVTTGNAGNTPPAGNAGSTNPAGSGTSPGGAANTGASPNSAASTQYSSVTVGGGNAYPDYNAQMSKTISDLETRYRSLYDKYVGGDYTKTPYYQTIMDYYGIRGDNAANAERASGAANNGGNLDSYAAANARRQQLAFQNAAQSAALEAYNSEYNNLLNNLHSMGVDVNDLYGTWSGDLASQRNAGNAQYAEDTKRYISDNDLAAANNAANLEYLASLYGYDTNRDIAGINADTQRYGYDTNRDIAGIEAGANRDVAQTQANAQMYGYDTNRDIAQLDAETQKYVAYKQDQLARYQADIEAEIAKGDNASAEKIQQMVLDYNKERDALDRYLDQYKIDKNYALGVYKATPSTQSDAASTVEYLRGLGLDDATIQDYLYIFGYGNGATGGITTGTTAGTTTGTTEGDNQGSTGRYDINYYANNAAGLYDPNSEDGGTKYWDYLNSITKEGVPSGLIPSIDSAVKSAYEKSTQPPSADGLNREAIIQDGLSRLIKGEDGYQAYLRYLASQGIPAGIIQSIDEEIRKLAVTGGADYISQYTDTGTGGYASRNYNYNGGNGGGGTNFTTLPVNTQRTN